MTIYLVFICFCMDGVGDEKQVDWVESLKESEGMVLEWPAGQLLCPHYAVWSDDSCMKVYIPRGNGKVVTGERALDIVGGVGSRFAKLVPKRESPFVDLGDW